MGEEGRGEGKAWKDKRQGLQGDKDTRWASPEKGLWRPEGLGCCWQEGHMNSVSVTLAALFPSGPCSGLSVLRPRPALSFYPSPPKVPTLFLALKTPHLMLTLTPQESILFSPNPLPLYLGPSHWCPNAPCASLLRAFRTHLPLLNLLSLSPPQSSPATHSKAFLPAFEFSSSLRPVVLI